MQGWGHRGLSLTLRTKNSWTWSEKGLALILSLKTTGFGLDLGINALISSHQSWSSTDTMFTFSCFDCFN